MRYWIAILTLLNSAAYSQDYVAKWNSYGHSNYLVQKTMDTTLPSVTVGILKSTVNDTSFFFNVPGPTYYYRIVADQDTSRWVLVFNMLSIVSDLIYHPAKEPKQLKIKIIDAGDRYRIIFQSPRSQYCEFTLNDMQGRQLGGNEMFLNKGLNTYYIEQPHSSGIYIIHFQTDYEVINRKVVR